MAPSWPAAAAWGEELVDAMAACDPLDATMIGLVYFDRLSVPSVAERLAVPLARVRTGLARGLHRIGQDLGAVAAS